MTKRIQSYRDLLEEKERLQILFDAQKEIIKEDIQLIKEEIAPIRSAVSFAGKIFTRDNSNLLLNAGTGAVIDLVVKRLFLSKAGWITKRVIPFLLKNFSSHFISENKGSIVKKVFSWLRKSTNGQEKAYKAYKN